MSEILAPFEINSDFGTLKYVETNKILEFLLKKTKLGELYLRKKCP